MKRLSGLMLSFLVSLLPTAVLAAGATPESMLSFQGFTGILNTPSAHVSNEGSIHLFFSDQKENIWRDDRNRRQENYLMSIGLFSFFELGGRLTEAPGRARDLSASFKVTSAPFTKDRPYWPVLAAGVQDVGGGANLLESRYVVLSEDLWRFRLSAGYGFKEGRMKGAFGGAEFKAHDWVTLLGEYDTRDTSVGARIITPEIWKTPIRAAATFKSALNHKPGNIDIAVGVTFPLDFRKRPVTALPDKVVNVSVDHDMPSATSVAPSTAQVAGSAALQQPQPPVSRSATPTTNKVTSSGSTSMERLRTGLIQAGFIKVRVGQRNGSELVVEYENSIYNHNELDALGVVAGLAAESADESYDTIHLVIVRKGLRVAVISLPKASLQTYLRQAGNVSTLRESLRFSYDTGLVDEAYFLPEAGNFVVPETSLILAPGLQTFFGTDFGVFDYVLSLKPELVSNLWKGSVFQARWDIPLAWSENFDDGRPFRGNRKDARMDRGMLFQGINLAPGLMANLGGGMVLHGIYGTLNEITWSPGDGSHRVRGFQAWARDRQADKNLTSYIGSYRYLHAPLDLSLEVSGGRFWGQDRGFSLELKRFFADTAVSAYYKNSTTEAGKHWQMAGVQVAFPLTPRKDLKVGPLLLRGADEWGYAQETTLAIGGQKTNDVLSQSLAVNPQPTPAVYRSYYNRDRLTAGYVRQNLERLRESWERFGISKDVANERKLSTGMN